MSVSISHIISAIEEVAPLTGQEEWDNSGLLVGLVCRPCTGVMLALDVTPEVMAQAKACGCNLVVAHHPLIFKGIKAVNESTPQGAALIEAIKDDIAVYCSHTALDNAPAPYGVSCAMAGLMDAGIIDTLTAQGTGVLARLPRPLTMPQLAEAAVKAFKAEGARISSPQPDDDKRVELVAFGGGACGFLIPEALRRGAGAIITSDVRYHDFLDYGGKIFIVDLTHFDTEKCTKAIFRRIISQKIPNFAQVFDAVEHNPIRFI